MCTCWVFGVCLPPTSRCPHCGVTWGVYSELGTNRSQSLHVNDAVTSRHAASPRIPAGWVTIITFPPSRERAHCPTLPAFFCLLDFRVYLLMIESTKNKNYFLPTYTILSYLKVLVYLILMRTLPSRHYCFLYFTAKDAEEHQDRSLTQGQVAIRVLWSEPALLVTYRLTSALHMERFFLFYCWRVNVCMDPLNGGYCA